MDSHNSNCSCHSNPADRVSEKERELHIQLSESSRREFLKNATKLSLSLGFGGGLITPLSASALMNDDTRIREIERSDVIKQEKAQRITILHTADIHAQLLIHDEFFLENGSPVYKKRGGYATLKTMINQLRNQNPGNTFLVDGGDCFQGGGVAALSEGRAIIPLMNNIRYDLVLPGNWEVAYGKKMMIEDLSGYSCPKVCANMFHKTEIHSNSDLIFPPYFIKQIAGLKIGFIGYNDPLTPKRQPPAYSEGIHFTTPDLNVGKYIRILREHEGCHMVMLVTHMGLTQQIGLANMPMVKGVDYILGADTHERVREPLMGAYAKVTEPGAFGSFVAKLDLVVEDGAVKEHSYQLLDVDPDRYKEDEEMKALVKQAREPYRIELDRKIGTTKTPLVRYYVIETPMDNFITDAIMWKFNPDIALSNGFRFCPPLVPDPQTREAAITKDFLWSMLPVNSPAKKGEVTGRQLLGWMENELENTFAKDATSRFGGWMIRFNGMEINFTIGNEPGKRINWIKIKGVPLQLNKTYTFVACERDGDPGDTICRMENVSRPEHLGVLLHTIIEEYLAVHSPISPKLEGRATATDASQTLLTQLVGFGYEFR